MSQSKPFHRTYRPFTTKPEYRIESIAKPYMTDRAYAQGAEHYIRAFIMIQDDLKKLFEYIEPSDQNLKTYSHRIHELFMRTCIEVEANFKAVLKENSYNPINKKGKARTEKDWKINDYQKVNTTHHLSSYKVHCPVWDGIQSKFEPFKDWKSKNNLLWYQAYNSSKHDRQGKFREANLENLLNAVTGLLVLLSSQFSIEDFSGISPLGNSTRFFAGSPGLGLYFGVEFPKDWDESEKYDFDWNILKDKPDKFQKINYDDIP
jgi:hypothetical protein